MLENLLGAGIIDEETFRKVKAMRGFRNIVVHRYGKIDDRITFRILRDTSGIFMNSPKRSGKTLETLENK